MLSLHGEFLTCEIHRHREIKLMHYDDTEKSAHNSQIVRAEENVKLSHSGPASAKYQAPTIYFFTSEPSLSLRRDPPSCN